MSKLKAAQDALSEGDSPEVAACLFKIAWTGEEDGADYVWLHFDVNAQDVREALLEHAVPPSVIRYLTRAETRPAARVLGGGLTLILRGINFNASQDPVDMVSLRCYLEPNRLVTVRSRWLASLQETRKEVEDGDLLGQPADLVLAIVEKMTNKISRHIEVLDDALETYEIDAESDVRKLERQDFGGLRRQIASVYRFIAPQRSALTTLLQIGAGRFNEDQLERVAEFEDLTRRYAEDLELHRERATSLQEARLNALQAEQNRRAYALSLVAGLFLPATFVTGLFGMNVAGLPGTENPFAFSLVIGSMALISASVFVALKLNKWL